jgi:hypothetical protein
MLTKPRPRAHQRLYDLLDAEGHAHVFGIYEAVRGRQYSDGDATKCMRNIGALVAQFNKRSTDCLVVPGPEVFTYRLHRG